MLSETACYMVDWHGTVLEIGIIPFVPAHNLYYLASDIQGFSSSTLFVWPFSHNYLAPAFHSSQTELLLETYYINSWLQGFFVCLFVCFSFMEYCDLSPLQTLSLLPTSATRILQLFQYTVVCLLSAILEHLVPVLFIWFLIIYRQFPTGKCVVMFQYLICTPAVGCIKNCMHRNNIFKSGQVSRAMH